MIVYNQIYLKKYLKRNLDFHFERAINTNEQNLVKILEESGKILKAYCPNNSDTHKIEYTNKYIVAQMYQMLKDVHDLFEKKQN